MTDAVRLEALRRVYDDTGSAVTALDGVTAGFARATFTAVMGPSGSGKSTLLQCAAGLDRPTSGRVFIDGTELTAVTEAAMTKFRRRRVGFVFQDHNLMPALTVEQNAVLPLRLAGRRVDRGRVAEVLDRDSVVTRLGQGVDASGALADEAIERVFAVLEDYRDRLRAAGAEADTALLTSAVRDAANGPGFTEAVRERFGLDARTIGGDEEAELTFLGATSERAPGHEQEELVVFDIGGGSTEVVVGHADRVDFHTSLQIGVVRMGERHLHSDPPTDEELEHLRLDARRTLDAGVPAAVRAAARTGIAVAGTATTSAAIELELDPYDATRAHGHVLAAGTLERLAQRLAALPERERRCVRGLHPDRAPVIVAGLPILLECLRAFGLEEVEVSEHDVLRGAALRLAAER